MKKAWFLSVLALFAWCAVPAQANTITYQAILNGPSESPPTISLGTGLGIITIDDLANTMRVQITFAGLVTTGTGTTASHIHCCTPSPFSGTAGVATQTPTFAGFPLGVRSGTYDQTFDLGLASTWNPAFITGKWQHGACCGSRLSRRSGERHGLSEHPLEYVRGWRDSGIHPGGAGAGDDLVAWPRALEPGVAGETPGEVDITAASHATRAGSRSIERGSARDRVLNSYRTTCGVAVSCSVVLFICLTTK